MTIEETKTALNKWLHQWLRDPAVSVQLARVSGAQPVTGQYLVGPDGTINLRQYGVAHIAGKTVTEARIAIQNHLKQFLDSPELAVDVVAYNSKVYYIIIQGAGIGDNVRRLPITGNETVLDAISQVNGLSQVSSKKIWIARPAPHSFGCQQILPIDWDAIAARRPDGDELPDSARRPVVRGRGRVDNLQQHRGQGHRPDRAHGRHHGTGQLHDPRLRDDGPPLQCEPKWTIALA